MTRVVDFANHLFPILANELIFEENPDSSEKNLDSEAENLEYSDSKDISRSVLMLSYAYGSAFRQSLNDVHTILKRAEENPMIYVRCFAKIVHEKYSPLKFLVVCSFISEIFLFLIDDSKRKHYVQRTTEALKDVYHRSFEKDFPQNGWTDIQNVASKIARGFQYFEPFMDHQNSKLSAFKIAKKLLKHKYEDENECQHVDTAMAGAQQELVNVNVPFASSSQVFINIPAIVVPILSADGFLTNQSVFLVNSENLMHPPVNPISFGTVDEDPQLFHLLHFSGYQTEAVTFENQPSGTEPNFQKVEAAERLNIEPRAQENLTARSFEDGPEPSSPMLQLTESGTSKHCALNNAITSEQFGEEQFFLDISSSGSENKLGPSSQADKKAEESGRSIANNTIISEQESIDAGKHDCVSETLSKENDPQKETFSKEDSFGGNSTESKIFSTEDNVNSSENETFSREACDPGNAVFSKENVSDPESATLLEEVNSYGESSSESATFPTEDIVNDLESRIFLKEDTIARETAVNVLENHSETLLQRQSQIALQNFTTNEGVSSQKNAKQENEIEINFQTNEDDPFAKVLHLNLGGKKFVVRMPADMTLIFEYNGQTSSTKQPQT